MLFVGDFKGKNTGFFKNTICALSPDILFFINLLLSTVFATIILFGTFFIGGAQLIIFTMTKI